MHSSPASKQPNPSTSEPANFNDSILVETHRATARQILAGIIAIAALFAYFLIFAEFAFLRFAAEFVPAERMPSLMGALGVAGVVGSFAAAAIFTPARVRILLAAGFLACATIAALTLAISSELGALFASAAAGGALGWTTVLLALCLRPTLHRTRLGLWCGLGTGVAYAFCNLPSVFTATPHNQTIIASVAAVVGLASVFWIQSDVPHVSASRDYRNKYFALWAMLFLALVFLDSLLFYLIHQSTLMRQAQWTDSVVLLGNVFVHLSAAILTGIALDRGWPANTLLAALLLLVGACVLFSLSARSFPFARIVYVTGVSVYSTAFIWFAARSGRRWKIAALFSLSGWLGSALAIGVAMQNATPSLASKAAMIVLCASLAVMLARYVFVEKYKS